MIKRVSVYDAEKRGVCVCVRWPLLYRCIMDKLVRNVQKGKTEEEV